MLKNVPHKSAKTDSKKVVGVGLQYITKISCKPFRWTLNLTAKMYSATCYAFRYY